MTAQNGGGNVANGKVTRELMLAATLAVAASTMAPGDSYLYAVDLQSTAR